MINHRNDIGAASICKHRLTVRRRQMLTFRVGAEFHRLSIWVREGGQGSKS